MEDGKKSKLQAKFDREIEVHTSDNMIVMYLPPSDKK